MKTFWLSFTDAKRPEGQQGLGAAVIDLTPTDLALCRCPAGMDHGSFGHYLKAAVQKAWDTGCNPGGAITAVEITGHSEGNQYPRDVLMSQADIDALEPAIGSEKGN